MTGLIFQLSIPNFVNLREDLIDAIRSQVEHLTQWSVIATDLGSMELKTPAITVAIAQEIGSKLAALQIQYTALDLSKDYVVVDTNAPETYDGFGTLTLFTRDDGSREVAVERRHLNWQAGRYRSGLYRADMR